VPGVLDGRKVLFIFSREPGREERIYSLIELEATAGMVQRQSIYYYSPELLEYAAAALGVEAFTHGYQYSLPGGAATASELR
jgi:hypothetical protein